jgi:hypothetical protein
MPYTFPPYNPATPRDPSEDKKPKGTTDKRAHAYCADLRRYSGGVIEVTWTRSATWGATASVRSWEGRCSLASGCGYCKGSTALADALRYLGRNAEERLRIAGTGGCGYSTVTDALASCGWKLERMPSGRAQLASDLFRLEVIK